MNIFKLKIFIKGSGCCNQLIQFINGIMVAKYFNKQKIVCEGFYIDSLDENKKTKISEIFDIEKLNIFLESQFNVVIFDRIDSIFENDDISEYFYNFLWMNSINKDIFDTILQNLPIHKNISNLHQDFNIFIPKFEKINVIHLRCEHDACEHWSKSNSMNAIEFRDILYSRYINIIKEYITKNELTILLCYDIDNEVIRYMKENEYPFYMSKKLKDREINALVDLSLGSYANNVFVGNFNLKTYSGSTFSYFLYKKMKNTVKKISLDLDRINDDVQVTF